MAHHKSAIKRIKTSEAARLANRQHKSRIRTAIKSVLGAENKEVGESRLKESYALLDKLATKGIIHKNKAANQKSRLAKFISNL